MEDKNINDGKFSYGFLLSLLAWILSSFLASSIPRLLNIGNVSIGELLISITQGTLITFLSSLIIWIPLALIAGSMARKRGKKAVRWFVGASFFISLLVVGGCYGMLFSQ